jgi:hypothetical protein
MAGRQKQREDLIRLASEPDLEERILDLLERGKAFTHVHRETGISKAAFNKWIDAPDKAALVAAARARAADNLVAETLDIADTADPEETNHARLRIQARQWVAERWNKAAYGQQKAEVSINLNGLHFEALKARSAASATVLDAEPVSPKIETLDDL